MFATTFRLIKKAIHWATPKPEPVEKKTAELLYEAQRKLVDHEASGEHHMALADMYRKRIARLSGDHDVGALENLPINFKTGLRAQR